MGHRGLELPGELSRTQQSEVVMGMAGARGLEEDSLGRSGQNIHHWASVVCKRTGGTTALRGPVLHCRMDHGSKVPIHTAPKHRGGEPRAVR